jgi:hypothetical protein
MFTHDANLGGYVVGTGSLRPDTRKMHLFVKKMNPSKVIDAQEFADRLTCVKFALPCSGAKPSGRLF